MIEKEFSPDKIKELKALHHSDGEDVINIDKIHNLADRVSMAGTALGMIVDKPKDEIDYDEFAEVANDIMPVFGEVMEYLESYTENRMIDIEIEKDTVLERRNQIIDLMKEKGTEDPTIIGTGWRKTLYGKEFQNNLFARGVEIWYPGITRPTERSAIDTPVHITVIEDPDVQHEPRRISLSSKGLATTSTTVDSNLPDTQAWYEVLSDMQPDEWRKLIDTTISALNAAN